jgi:hypothetical protein
VIHREGKRWTKPRFAALFYARYVFTLYTTNQSRRALTFSPHS